MRGLIAVLAIFLCSAPLFAGRRQSRPYPSRQQSMVSRRSAVRLSRRAPGVPRDRHGRIERSEAAKRQFRKSQPCPATGRSSGPCPGYQIDHRTPLYKGGADRPDNMQWLTTQQHKAKHRRR